VAAATEKAVTVRNAIDSQRIATPCAAEAAVPSRLIRPRNQSWQRMFVRLSPVAGALIRKDSPDQAAVGDEVGPAQPQPGPPARQHGQDDQPAGPLAAGGPMAMPRSSSRGSGPSPMASAQLTAMLIALTRIMTHMPVRVSPAPRRQATPTVSLASNGAMTRTIRR
jgi:hypothetical protein